MIASQADEAEIHLYTQGFCHVFAVALSRNLGWPLLVVTDPTQPAWTDDRDPDNQIDSVVHVFAVHDGMAIDVHGERPLEQVQSWCRETFGTFIMSEDHLFSESELALYVQGTASEGNDQDDTDRPLSSYTDEDVEDAWRVAQRVLPIKVHSPT